jgi:GNAT superfamily N-acetyltransferase
MSNDNYFIRGFRDDEWELLRSKRLEAVAENAHVYLGNYDAEAALSDEHWKNLIGMKDGKIFGLFAGWRLIGLTGVYRNKYDASGKSVMLGMSYIERAYRRRGLSAMLYDARLEWAKANGYERACVSHRDGNEASRRANAAFGFKKYATEETTYGDGSKALDHRYELRW